MSELDTKLAKIHELLDQRSLDALFLQRISSFAWATCGAASYINTATTTGEASALITRSGRYVVTNNIEAPHYEKEEKLKEQGWEFAVSPWYEPSEALSRLTGGHEGRLGHRPAGNSRFERRGSHPAHEPAA